MNIRKATVDDYSAVDPILVEIEHHHVSLEPEIFQPIQHYDQEHFNDLVMNPESFIMIAEEKDEIVGALIAVTRQWQPFPIFHGGEYMAVEELSVTKPVQGKGNWEGPYECG